MNKKNSSRERAKLQISQVREENRRSLNKTRKQPTMYKHKVCDMLKEICVVDADFFLRKFIATVKFSISANKKLMVIKSGQQNEIKLINNF